MGRLNTRTIELVSFKRAAITDIVKVMLVLGVPDPLQCTEFEMTKVDLNQFTFENPELHLISACFLSFLFFSAVDNLFKVQDGEEDFGNFVKNGCDCTQVLVANRFL